MATNRGPSRRKGWLEGTEDEPRVREARAKGWGVDRIAAQLALPRDQVATLIRKIDAETTGEAFQLDPAPELGPDATPLERAQSHSLWLKSQLDRAVATHAPAKEVAVISAQYATSLRLVGQLSGAFEVTASQIVKSVDFQRALTALQRAVGDNREVWERWEKELASLLGES